MLRDIGKLPNLLSLSRIVLTVPAVWMIARQDNHSALIAMVILIIAGITDGLDGYFARRRNEITRLGLTLDPLADKIMAAVLVLAVIYYRDFPLWLALAIVGRDLLILIASALLLKGKDILVPSSLVGKYAFASVAVLLASHVIRFDFGIRIMTICAVLLLAASLIVYTRLFLRVRKGEQITPYAEKPTARLARFVVTLAITVVFLYRLIPYLIALWRS